MSGRRVLGALILGIAGLASRGVAAPPAGPRAEVPIREVILSDGVRRYALPVKIGGVTLDAGLDTGSSGLRVLPGVLGPDDARQVGGGSNYSYGSGADLRGVTGEATVAIGGLAAPARLQLVEHVGCTPQQPRCPASRVSEADYGVQGDGLPHEGFKAILGTNMGDAEVPSLLPAMGARRWIVELPRPGEGLPGRLILNPTAEETAGFVAFKTFPAFAERRGGLHDAIGGCLVNLASKARACGAVLLDSGAPGLDVANGGLGGQPWPDGTAAALTFGDPGGQVRAVAQLQIGQRSQVSHLTYRPDPRNAGPVIYSGLTAYFAFSVLYDADARTVALKPRPQAPGGPIGTTVPAS
ncbi:MAG: hypothetical protein E7812_13455 [Phenylobacterium sp.]|nr:MAG: hypothetical protein E7812_13455 [Phenylobacterium sp.]